MTHQFYGIGSFYPNLFSPDEAHKAKQTIHSDLWPLCLDVTGIYETLRIVSVEPRRVVLGTQWGMPTITLSYDSGEIRVANFTRHFKQRGSDKYTIKSKNRPYLIKQMRDMMPQIIKDADQRALSFMASAAIAFLTHLDNDTNNAWHISEQSLSPEAMMSALRVVFDDGFHAADIPSPDLHKMRTKYEELVTRFSKKKTHTERLHDMFNNEKWIVYHFPYHTLGTTPVVIGSATLLPVNAREVRGTIVEPLRLYRNFDAYYAQHPDNGDALKTALMFTKVQREKQNDTQSIDKDGFIPLTTFSAYEDVGSFAANTGVNIAQPQILIMGK